jgi:hypothetical protein
MGTSSRISLAAVAGVILLTVATGCATGSGSPAPFGTSGADLTEVVGTGTVIEDGEGPRLCFVVMESHPPQCGAGIELEGWSWEGVEGSESASGISWGSYAVQGTVDGEVLTVTRPPILLALYDPAPIETSDDPRQAALDERFGEGALRIVEPSAEG